MKLFKSIFEDLMLILGFICVVYGVYLMNKPASYIVAGVLLLAAFVPKSSKKPEKEAK